MTAHYSDSQPANTHAARRRSSCLNTAAVPFHADYLRHLRVGIKSSQLNIHVIVNPKGDKRQSAFAEGAVQKMKLMVQAGLIDMRLPATWWQRLADYAWHIHNLYPVQRKVASGETPIEELSGGNVTRTTVERRIE